MEYLKIKDGVDLKELEKFGFELDRNFNYGYAPEIVYVQYPLVVIPYNRKIELSFEYDYMIHGENFMVNLFDLIQAGIVEKVVEND